MRLSFIGWTPTQGWEIEASHDIISLVAGLQFAPTKPGQVCRVSALELFSAHHPGAHAASDPSLCVSQSLLQRSTTVPDEVRTRRWLSRSGFRSASFRAGSPRHEQSRSRSEVDSLRRHKPQDRLSAKRGQAHERFCTAAQEGQWEYPLR